MLRIDKWLWAARFFKTRSLAKKQLEQGKVTVNQQKCKPSRSVNVGDVLRIKKNNMVWEVTILELSERRGSATVAQTLYRESEQSIKQRESAITLKKMSFHSTPKPNHKPDKRQRRNLRKLKTGQ